MLFMNPAVTYIVIFRASQCWFPGALRRQITNNHDTDFVELRMFVIYGERVELIGPWEISLQFLNQ